MGSINDWNSWDRSRFIDNVKDLAEKLDDLDMDSEDKAKVLCLLIDRLTGGPGESGVKPVAQGRMKYENTSEKFEDLFYAINRMFR